MRRPQQFTGLMRRPGTPASARRVSVPKSYPAPTGGWISNRNLAQPAGPGLPQGAAMLENWFPTATGVIMRRGSELYSTVGEGANDIEALFSYKNGAQEELFTADADSIYDITIGSSPTLGIGGQTSGDWVVVQFETPGGVFLRGVNGADTPLIYDGATWGTSPAITGPTPEDLSYVWAYRNRLFFVERNSLNAWYLPVDSIGGAASEFPLGGVFTRGGTLMFGASWSLDSGSGGQGLTDQCIFVSTEGEVAVYQGSNPGNPADWALVGVYRLGRPLGKNAHIRGGGDLVIATDIGFVPLSTAVQRDYAALAPSAISYSIEDDWQDAAARRFGAAWNCAVWPSAQMVIVALPTVNEQPPTWFVANARTGAWAPFGAWDATCVEIFQERCFFGSRDGKIIEANVTGADQGTPYTASFVPLFEDLGAPTALKVSQMARAVLRGPTRPNDRLSLQKEFLIELPPEPDAVQVTAGSNWDAAIWGEATWGEEAQPETFQIWRDVSGTGYTLAPALQITSADVTPLDVAIVRLDFLYEVADAIT